MAKQNIIIVLIRKLPTSSGGIQVGIFKLYEYLRSRGFDITFILNGIENKVFKYRGFDIVQCPFPPVFHYPFSKRFWIYIKRSQNIKKRILRIFEDKPNLLRGVEISKNIIRQSIEKKISIK